MKSTPRLLNPDYPALGFNPVPGSLGTVRALRKKLADCADVLGETHGVVSKLMDGGHWKGDAAVAFRAQIEDGTLPRNLRDAARSVRKAARQLGFWCGELDELRHRARRLNEDAEDARGALATAKRRADLAGDDPALKKTEAEGHAAAKRAHHAADAAVKTAEGDLARILAKAHDLAAEHEVAAGARAAKIRAATEKLAPREPGFFEELGEWITDNLPDILSFVAGVVGLVALFVLSGGVLAAVLLLAAAAMGLGAATLRVTDPKVWSSLKDGLTKGELDSDFWSNSVAVSADALGALPGLGAAARGGSVAVRALGEGAEVLTLGQRVSMFGSQSVSEARALTGLGNPLLAVVVRGAGDPVKSAETVELVSASTGVATAGYGLAASAAEALDVDVAKDASTGIDGLRAGLDSGAVVDLARHLFS
ncbi:hypothetical protein [Streptomyces tsukubensis]|uniref:hypothetical protein n=1 Tax=Streptomyces tsukubensis TaxID=83656 RepID=UPI00098FA37A|nr:hypothetical protein [Streptomyces tsukubensis]